MRPQVPKPEYTNPFRILKLQDYVSNNNDLLFYLYLEYLCTYIDPNVINDRIKQIMLKEKIENM